MITHEWNYHYNLEGKEWIRQNLVYTPYISPDKKTMCMSFNRDPHYHVWPEENALWTNELLTDRFAREVTFHEIARKASIPTLKIQDINVFKREIYIEWHGDDFLMQGLNNGGYDKVLPNWQAQWLDRITEMWQAGIYKFSLHPNSWVAVDGVLTPYNWFFSFKKDEPKIKIRDLLIQISIERQDKLQLMLNHYNMDLDTPYDIRTVQLICFNSFRSNYPDSLIDQALKNQLVNI